MGDIKAEIEVDSQHGPIVRIQHGEDCVAVYLLSETGVVTTPKGQYGIEITGSWVEFMEALDGGE